MAAVASQVERFVKGRRVDLPELVGMRGQMRRQFAIQQFPEVCVLALSKELPRKFDFVSEMISKLRTFQ